MLNGWTTSDVTHSILKNLEAHVGMKFNLPNMADWARQVILSA